MNTNLQGHIVRVERRVGTLNTGLYEGQPTERVVVRVQKVRPDGWLLTFDSQDTRFMVKAEAVLEDLGPAAAGWMNW